MINFPKQNTVYDWRYVYDTKYSVCVSSYEMALVMHFFDEVLLVPAGRCVWSMYFSLFNLLVLCTHRFLFFLHWLQIRFGPVVFNCSITIKLCFRNINIGSRASSRAIVALCDEQHGAESCNRYSTPRGQGTPQIYRNKKREWFVLFTIEITAAWHKNTTNTRRQKETTHHRFMMKWMSFSLVLRKWSRHLIDHPPGWHILRVYCTNLSDNSIPCLHSERRFMAIESWFE